MPVQSKICGLRDPKALAAAVEGGARYVGFVFFPRSPRDIAAPLAAELARQIPTGVRAVGLFVDPGDDLLEHVLASVPLDMIQLHGHETPARAAAIRARYALPVMKAVPVAVAGDLDRAAAYQGAVDRLLFDAKPPTDAQALPGGNGRAFDWALLTGRTWGLPWMLSGGLTADNVGRALAISGAPAVDVSSGVESAPGVKDPDMIRAFLAAVAGA